MLTLLLGGARSGKSALAVEIGAGASDGRRVFVATSPPAVDADMDERIARHRAERPGLADDRGAARPGRRTPAVR